jgi:hypothetical protein
MFQSHFQWNFLMLRSAYHGWDHHHLLRISYGRYKFDVLLHFCIVWFLDCWFSWTFQFGFFHAFVMNTWSIFIICSCSQVLKVLWVMWVISDRAQDAGEAFVVVCFCPRYSVYFVIVFLIYFTPILFYVFATVLLYEHINTLLFSL